ncbi:MAG: hypothetical protein AAB614_00210 [Patescibacteria group bacterium]
MPNRDLSINDLLSLQASGIPVTLTSHPGNASLYKSSLWSCGIQENLWDITCAKADKNNWPKHKLVNGESIPLLSEETIKSIDSTATSEHRYVTAYLKSDMSEHLGQKLGRIHVQAMQQSFSPTLSSCSRLLLSEKEKISEMFEYLAHTCPEKVFTRYISDKGIMVPLKSSNNSAEFHPDFSLMPKEEEERTLIINSKHLASSFINLLSELDNLLFSDEPIITHGGVCYNGPISILSNMLVYYWKTGETHRYDISGPDMIHYATRKEYQNSLSLMLQHLRKWSPALIPKNITVHMPMGTVARIGYIKDHPSEEIMHRRLLVAHDNGSLTSKERNDMRLVASNDEIRWPMQINPAETPYFSQFDLVELGKSIIVDEYWKDIPLGDILCIFSKIRNKLLLKK